MTRFFNSPFLLGFENLEKLLERTARNAGEGYPPYNIEQLGEEKIAITLAVAGFGLHELTVSVEDNQLVVRGNQQEPEGKTFLHKGIAARHFLRAFVLADGIEVISAALQNGLLRIELVRPHPKQTVRVIEINGGKS